MGKLQHSIQNHF